MKKISAETAAHVATLARLELDPEALEKNAADLSNILGLVAQLETLDLSGVNLDLAEESFIVMRPDEVVASIGRELLLDNAPEPEEGFFRVPKILES